MSRADDEVLVEMGAGTGTVSHALLDAGIPPERLLLIEIVPEMANHLRRALPGVTVLAGGTFALPRIQAARWWGKVGTAICGIPLVLPPPERRRRFVQAVQAVAPERGLLLYTYCVTSPLPPRALDFKARREAWMPLNVPPASVWRYRPVLRS